MCVKCVIKKFAMSLSKVHLTGSKSILARNLVKLKRIYVRIYMKKKCYNLSMFKCSYLFLFIIYLKTKE